MLEIQHLQVSTPQGKSLLEDISFSLQRGSIIGITGESGAGKTTLLKAILGMLEPPLRMQGTLTCDDTNLRSLSASARRAMCGTTLGFIPQIPMTAFDPRLTIGHQMRETFRYKRGGTRAAHNALAETCLKQVNLTDTKRILASRPCNLSGGMLQRIAVALTLGLQPKYILADEPTSALDEENRDMLLDLLSQQKSPTGILLVSHDYRALETITDRMIVLHRGKNSAYPQFADMVQQPRDPWTKQFAAHYKPPEKEGFVWKAL